MKLYKFKFYSKEVSKEGHVKFHLLGSVIINDNLVSQRLPLVGKAFKHAPRECAMATNIEWKEVAHAS